MFKPRPLAVCSFLCLATFGLPACVSTPATQQNSQQTTDTGSDGNKQTEKPKAEQEQASNHVTPLRLPQTDLSIHPIPFPGTTQPSNDPI